MRGDVHLSANPSAHASAHAETNDDPIASAIDKAADLADRGVSMLERVFGKDTKPAAITQSTTASAPRIEAGGSSAPDGAVMRELRLTSIELAMLKGIAERGGEIDWNWSNCRPDVKAMMAEMINKQIVREREHVRGNRIERTTIALTDAGRQCLTQSARMVQRRLITG